MQLVSLYPFDPTGRASANRIENQSLTITPPTSVTDYSYAVPRGAPFYAESLVVKDSRSTGARTLVENVDYWCVIDFLSASVSLNKRISVGIALLDPGYSGTLYVTYQAVGGNYSLADYSILEELIRERYVVKHVSYEQIVNLPEGFAPDWHEHQVADMVGMSQVVSTLSGVKTAIEGREGSYGQLNTQLSNHIGGNSAHTPSQIGLGNVKNYDVASLAEATTGAGNKYITGGVLKQYVQQMQPNLTGYITTANANTIFMTKSQFNGYSTTLESDSKYALKSDSYTKTQIDAIISGNDDSGSLEGYYTKSQSDARYATSSSISDYIKTTIADGRYATKVDLSNVYSKSQSDDKYPLKNASYTVSQSDSRYLLTTALTGYLTQTVADQRYVLPATLTNYIRNDSATYGRINALSSTNTPAGKRITLTDSHPVLSKSISLDLDLSEYAKLVDSVSRDDMIKVYLYTMQKQLQWHRYIVTNTTVYGSYQLETRWVIKACKFTRSVKIQAYISTSFYFDENLTLTLRIIGSAALPATVPNLVNMDYLAFNAVAISRGQSQDYWSRPTVPYAVLNKSTASIDFPVRFSHDGDGYTYVNGFMLTAELDCITTTDFESVVSLLQATGTGSTVDMTTPPYGVDLRTHMDW